MTIEVTSDLNIEIWSHHDAVLCLSRRRVTLPYPSMLHHVYLCVYRGEQDRPVRQSQYSHSKFCRPHYHLLTLGVLAHSQHASHRPTSTVPFVWQVGRSFLVKRASSFELRHLPHIHHHLPHYRWHRLEWSQSCHKAGQSSEFMDPSLSHVIRY